RQNLSKQAKEEQEKARQSLREKRAKESEGVQLKKQKEVLEKQIEEASRALKRILRMRPIGTDRNHARYWVFEAGGPMLYVEKGWVTGNVGYSVEGSTTGRLRSSNDDDEDLLGSISDSEQDEDKIKLLEAKLSSLHHDQRD